MRSAIKSGILLLLVWMTTSAVTAAQEAGLVSCVPATGMQGQQVDVVIKGRFTNFQQQTVSVDFGPDIQVERLEIRDFESLVARLRVSPNAVNGPVDVRVRAGNAELVLPGGFTVLSSSGQLSAVLEVFPMQTVKMSDFEVNRITAAPIIFNVIIYNDNKVRDLKVRLTLKGDRYGLVGYSHRNLKGVQPGAVLRFTNREFDNYELNSRNNSLMQLIAKTNILPADAYDYVLELFDERGIKVGGAEASQVIVNLATRPELIMPGTLFGQQQTIISTPNPQFQWFSQASKFDFALYPVLPNQFSQEEVLLNRPIYAKEGLVTTSMVYPSSAEVLTDGQTYAWQVKARYASSRGEEVLVSDVFWFKYTKNLNQDLVTEALRITPSYTEVLIGSKVQFVLEAVASTGSRKLDLLGKDRNQVQLRLIPENKGSVDALGVFTAGNAPGPLALVVEFAGQTEYATILIKGNTNQKTDTIGAGMLDKLLGLPATTSNGTDGKTTGSQTTPEVQEQNGYGTRRSTTTVRSQPELLSKNPNAGTGSGSSHNPTQTGTATNESKTSSVGNDGTSTAYDNPLFQGTNEPGTNILAKPVENGSAANAIANQGIPSAKDTTVQEGVGAGTRSEIPRTRSKPGLRHETQPGPGINGATGNGQQTGGVGADTTVQEGVGAGTRSEIPRTRSKPGLRHETQPGPGINGATGNGQQTGGVGADTTVQEGVGAGTRSEIPRTRSKPGLRHETQPGPGINGAMGNGQQTGGVGVDTTVQASNGSGTARGKTTTAAKTNLQRKAPNSGGVNTDTTVQEGGGAGTRSAIPSTRNKPGLRRETQPGPGINGATGNGQQTGGVVADTTVQEGVGAGTRSEIPRTRSKPGLRHETQPGPGINGATGNGQQTGGVGADTTVQEGVGAGTRSEIPRTRSKPGLRHETQPGPGINGATGNGQQTGGVGADTTVQGANGAGTRSDIPRTRSKPGLRRETQPGPGINGATGNGQQTGGVGVDTTVQASNGSGTARGKTTTAAKTNLQRKAPNSGGVNTDTTVQEGGGAGTRSAIPSTRNKPGLRRETQPGPGINGSTGNGQQTGGLGADTTVQGANGAGTRSEIPRTRSKPGLRHETQPGPGINGATGNGQQTGGVGADTTVQKGGGAGTRSAIPSTRNKPGLR